MNNEDLLMAVIIGVSVKVFSIIHDVAVSMGLETPLNLVVLIVAGVLVVSSLLEGRRP